MLLRTILWLLLIIVVRSVDYYNISEEVINFSLPSLEAEPINMVLGEGERKLIQLQIFFRHGMRAPDQTYPTNPNPDHVWREGLGRLTQHGKNQQYALGKQLRWMYRDFISSSPAELEVLSSHRNRCVLSALCHVAGLYKPTSEWEFVPGMPWQPIPVLYAAHGKDPYLGKVVECPAANKEIKKMIKSEEGTQFIEEHQELFDYWTEHSGLIIKNWADASTLYDILNMHKTYNHITPDWAETHWDKLHYINDMSFYLNGKTKEYQKLRAGPLLGLILSKMETKVTKGSAKKVHIYSGHSKNMVAVLSALGIFNKQEPPFCATLLFEFYKEAGQGHTVRLLFMNSTTPEYGDQQPHVLKLPKCEEYCPFRKFTNLLNELIPLDWEEACNAK